MVLIKWNLIGYKRKLSRDRKNTLKKLQEFKILPDFGSEADPDTETDESEEISNQMAEAQVLKKHLADIELALTKIKKGTYGICENCKEEISRELLNVAPESQLCQNCKQKISR
jgi:RNA polymerase-binding transcription factor DksA